MKNPGILFVKGPIEDLTKFRKANVVLQQLTDGGPIRLVKSRWDDPLVRPVFENDLLEFQPK